jgi:isopropylmalate/homocitrate/citramalate synthase
MGVNTGEWGSLYNYLPAARENLALPEKVILNDVTLREGIQASKLPFDVGKKVALARLLDEVGLSQIQVGYPARSDMDKEAIRAMKEAGVNCALEGICTVAGPQWREEIETTGDSGADIINVALPTSDTRLRYVLKMSRDEVLKRAESAVRLVKGYGRFVVFSPIDTTRTDLSFLKEVLAAVTEAGADRFYIIDTVGTISPMSMRYLVTEIKKVSSIPLATHCHDDFGLAVANGLAAVECGAEVVDVGVNGMGKRAGNLSLEEIALALTIFHGKELGIKLERLYELSRAVAEMTKVPVYDAKPIVGANAFDFEVDAQLRGTAGHVLRGSVDPAVVGHPGRAQHPV